MIVLPSSIAKASAGQRRYVVAQAAADRRSVVVGLVAGVTALTRGKADAAVTPVDLFDDRSRANAKTGWDIIEEARDWDLPINERDGITQYRNDMKATKARFSESANRIKNDVRKYIDKGYWNDAYNELRHQMGTMRLDMRTITSSMPSKSDRKEGQAKARSLIGAVEELDYALQRGDQSKTPSLYAKVNDELSAFTKFAMG